MAENSLLGKLDGLVSRFEEVGTLITDPAVIADMKRFVKLNKEYRDLEKIVGARSEYVKVLNGIEEAKALLESEQDPEMREMAREELDTCNERIPALEEEIKLLLPLIRKTTRTRSLRYEEEREVTKPPFSPVIYIVCT